MCSKAGAPLSSLLCALCETTSCTSIVPGERAGALPSTAEEFVGDGPRRVCRLTWLVAAQSASFTCVFEQLSAEDNSEAFFWSWMWSLAQRFIAMEPILILIGALLPMLFASQFCANMCSESFNTALGVAFAVCITLSKRLRRF